MIKIRRGALTGLGQELLRGRTRMGVGEAEVEMTVGEVLKRVQKDGDKALLDFTREFDGVDLVSKGLRVRESDVASAREKTTREEVRALEYLQRRVAKVERRRLKSVSFTFNDGSIRMLQTTRPIGSVGCYIPGGRAVYPSTVLMTVVPAKVAGVPRMVLCSPPSGDGEIEPLVLVAADLCGVDEIYRIGGAQAIAAMAYGTDTIEPVDKIVGPASKFVTAAKRKVSGTVAIDLPAGPSELLVLADETANPRIVALDLISQAEHAPDNVPVLVTTSQRVQEEVDKEIRQRLRDIGRREIVEEAFSQHGGLLLAPSMAEALAFVNEFSPEHLEIQANQPKTLAKAVTSAGIVLVGEYTPAAASDYCLGTNHVLPTMGFARTHSGLSVLDYVKRIPIVECRRPALKKMLRPVRTLSQREGLPNHLLALEGRFSDD